MTSNATKARDPTGFPAADADAELPTYVLSPVVESPGRRAAVLPLPGVTASPLSSSLLGGVGFVPPLAASAGYQAPSPSPSVGYAGSTSSGDSWRDATDEMRRLRARNVVLIERMLSNHQPHDVLTQVPENFNWHSKTFALAIKIERLMFASATSKESYLNESTLRTRVQFLSRHLVRIRKRKNAIATAYSANA